MQLHSGASTCPKQRLQIRQSPESCRAAARRLRISPATVHRWKHREDPRDRSCAPKTRHYALKPAEQRLVLYLRRQDIPLDDLVEMVSDVIPHARRASVYRLLCRHDQQRLPKRSEQETGKPGQFKDYPPGFVHIDCLYLPVLEGKKRYAFVAVDRATRLVLISVYESRDKLAGAAFLAECIAFYPFRIEKVLTDNGSEFTNRFYKRLSGVRVRSTHPFDDVCAANGIDHRLTQPYTPKTNGLVERTNGLIREGTTKRHRYQAAAEMLDDLSCWQSVFNYKRRNRRLGGKTPYEAACDWYRKRPDLFTREPAHMLMPCS